MTAIDLNRATSGVNLPATVANEVWSRAVEASAVMRATRQIPLPGVGVAVPMISSQAAASWVDETEEKPVSRPGINNKTISAYMASVIVPFSNQFRRDGAALYNEIVRNLPAALGKLFDQTVVGAVAAPGSNFDTLASSPAVSIATAGSRYTQFVAGLSSAVSNGADVEAWILSPQAELLVLGELDGNDRPLFTMNAQTDGSVGSILARPVYKSRVFYYNPTEAGTDTTADTVGVGGPFQTGAVWGQTDNISLAISDQATLHDGSTTINLFQRNLFAVRVECEFGFRVYDTSDFVRLSGAVTQ